MKKKKEVVELSALDVDELVTTLHSAYKGDLAHLEAVLPGDVPVHYIRSLENAFRKKVRISDADEQGKANRAFEDFIANNIRMRDFSDLTCRLPAADCSVSKFDSRTSVAFIRARSLMQWCLGTPPSLTEWFALCKLSDGATSNTTYERSNPEDKWKYPISTNEGALRLFELYLVYDPILGQEIELSNNTPNRPLFVNGKINRKCFRITDSAVATTVPKDDRKRRFIAKEPTLCMFFQQGVMALLYKRLASVGLDVSNLQFHHTQLAARASITGNNATIDFSSASDCVSREYLKWCFPPAWFGLVDSITCRRVYLDREYYDLNMFSTMGNAMTFPIETLVFWTLAVGTVSAHSDLTNSRFAECKLFRSCSVFGDDVILPSSDAQTFIECARTIGFVVNQEKSFIDPEPGFRESCGGDYFRGRNVRPLYLGSPHSFKADDICSWLYTLWNASLKKYKTYFGEHTYVYYNSLQLAILRELERYGKIIHIVPHDYPDSSGLLDDADLPRVFRQYPVIKTSLCLDRHGTFHYRYLRFLYPCQRKPKRGSPYKGSFRYGRWCSQDPVKRLLGLWDGIDTGTYVIKRHGGFTVSSSVEFRTFEFAKDRLTDYQIKLELSGRKLISFGFND